MFQQKIRVELAEMLFPEQLANIEASWRNLRFNTTKYSDCQLSIYLYYKMDKP